MEMISIPFEVYTLERTLEQNIFRKFRVETSIQIEIFPLPTRELLFQADIIYTEAVARYISDEINTYVQGYLDLSPHRN